MPTPIHESFSAKVSQETIAQLDSIGKGNGEAAEFVRRIFSVRSGSIRLREIDSDDDIETGGQSYILQQPDDQFEYEEAESGVVYKTAWS